MKARGEGILRYEILKHRSKALRALTGLSREEFEDLYERFLPAWEAAERKRLSRPDQLRAIGVGTYLQPTFRTLSGEKMEFWGSLVYERASV